MLQKAAARRKRAQQAAKEPHGTSRTHEGTSVDPSAPASTVHSGASSSRKEGSLLGEKGQDSRTAAQDSRHTATESDRLRSCNAGSLPSTSASWKKRLCVAVALVAVMAFVAVAGLLSFLWSRHRAKEAAMASANKSVPSNTTKQSGGPVKKEKPAVQAIVTSVVKILGMVHRLLH
ncbi:uncharacterized protein LOC119402611 [Rhipicephalus sanguineus]|uniref:uncharacterized protein LOC119402611 n=1 Tax=Rhipicephalus sanguineus TaxID=34632 RepID=UPI0020C435DC|nr:uncharacterized protein LOC119402611 [Rhipicephalus sanguineus]